jgi:hypothetical protein
MVKKEVALAIGGSIETFTSAIETEWGFDDNDRLVSHKDDGDNDSTSTRWIARSRCSTRTPRRSPTSSTRTDASRRSRIRTAR